MPEQYTKEAMMVIAGASPTLAGLSGVVFGQVISYKMPTWLRIILTLMLLATVVLAILATQEAIDWLFFKYLRDEWRAYDFFKAQMGVFAFAVLLFWIIPLTEAIESWRGK